MFLKIRILCVILSHFRIFILFTVCSPHYYGNDCNAPCGQCRGDDICNNTTPLVTVLINVNHIGTEPGVTVSIQKIIIRFGLIQRMSKHYSNSSIGRTAVSLVEGMDSIPGRNIPN